MKAKVDAEKCIGCGVCAAICSQCFKMNGGVSEVQKDLCGECDLEEVSASCPVGAISVEK